MLIDRRSKFAAAFTMIELMVVILIVAILAMVAVPLMRGRVDSAKWCEAKALMGTIASALRAYAAEKGSFTSTDSLSLDTIGIRNTDLDGTYFSHEAYTFTASADAGRVSFVITATASKSTRDNMPSNPASMTLTCNSENNYVAAFAEGS
jgi:prepilin-type N-terminal cleavage/methylation domain-containing protein